MAKESLANALRSSCLLHDCLERTAAGSGSMLRDGKALAGGSALVKPSLMTGEQRSDLWAATLTVWVHLECKHAVGTSPDRKPRAEPTC